MSIDAAAGSRLAREAREASVSLNDNTNNLDEGLL